MDNILSNAALFMQVKSLSDLAEDQAAQLKTQSEQISKMQTLIDYYERQLLMMRRRQFGSSSEKTELDLRQTTLFGDASEIDPPPETETEEITYKRKKRKGKREEDLSGLPVERIDYELSEEERTCPECGETMRDIGVNVRRELKLIPAKVVVVEHASHAYACDNCEKTNDHTPIVKAEAPAPLISGSLASPSLVAHIAFQKYSNGMPLYRIEKGFRYDGVEISRQTMSNWVVNCTELFLAALYSLLEEHLLRETAIHSDGTVIQVLHEAGRAAQTKSCEWVYRTSGCSVHKIVVYKYTPTKGAEHPKEFLADFKGYLHTDGAPAYHDLGDNIIVVGCWQHVRHYYENILKTIPKDKRKDSDACAGLLFINKLFSLEREFAELSPDERYEKRLEKSKPVSDAFFEWADRLGALPKSPLGQAVHYTQSQRKFLENVFLDGRLELSNNRAERSVKPFVMGRKAWLFANTPSGAKASSVMYSLIETAAENGLHPYQYIKFLLERLPSARIGELEGLLPWSESLPDFCKAPIKREGTGTCRE